MMLSKPRLFSIALGLALACGPAAITAEAKPPPPAAPETSLHLAALQGDVEAVRRIVDAGADLDQKDAYGSSPLVIAATFGKAEVARALIDAGADLQVANAEGSTPLHIAAFFGRTEIVETLLQHGADRQARNRAGHTPLDTVAVPFDDVKVGYDKIARALAPLGLTLDHDRIRSARPGIAAMLRPTPEALAAVRYAPQPAGDLKVSTPAAQGLDPELVAELYLNAAAVPTLYGVLVLKNGQLIAEGYFHQGAIGQLSGRQSATKSVTSALVGIALDQGCLASIDQRMMDFFPEFADRIIDPRKRQITIRDLLQMRAGYPWEGRTPPYFDRLFLRGDWRWLPHLVDFPLLGDPGAAYGYSNLTSHLLAVIVARACKTDLMPFAQQHLFAPIDARVHDWTRDADGYRWGWGEIYLTARDMAKFGLLYLRRGRHEGRQVVAADWVERSLRRYSQGINFTGAASSAAGLYLRDIGYGYQWWSARAGGHRFDMAWGHGGQLIVLLHDLDMVIVTTADPLHHLPEQKGWQYEGAVIDLVGRFINALPKSAAGTPR